MEESDVESTPGRMAIAAMEEIKKDIVFKTPNSVVKRRKKFKVLDEEAYLGEMGKIIQRDFFPDLDKLKAQNEYLDAVEKNDLEKMRELHVKYSGRRPPTEREPSPATFETPVNIHSTQNLTAKQVPVPETPKDDADKDSSKVPPLSLDAYLNSHTSEDNHSFEEIMIESEKKHFQKYSYLYNEEFRSETDQKNMLALPSIEEQCALPEKQLDIDTWGYKNRNYIMYIPDGVEPTKEQLVEMNKRRQEISYCNTRLSMNPFNEQQSKETITELAKTQAKILDGRIGVDGKEVSTDTPKIRGFGFVRTPSPCPGVAESPLMTWGEIEGTPFRLDGGDTPLVRSQGPSFKMAEPTKREQIAHALAEKVGERHRDRKQKAIEAARRQFATPSPSTRTSSRDRLASMSPAARRLATAKLGLSRKNTDSVLRAGYSPSPSPIRSKRRDKTPNLGVRTPKISSGGSNNNSTANIVSDLHITDDLLKIEVPKRKTAADFF